MLDRFHLIHFFTDALRRRSFLNETKRHHHVRVIDCALAFRPEALALDERDVAYFCILETLFTLDFYQGLQHIRYVLKATYDGKTYLSLKD